MKYQTDVNEVQALIVRQLSLRGSLRFSQINTEGLPSDQLSYHLRQLIKYGIVEKSQNNTYRLSVAGRSRAILFDGKTNKFIEQGFVACRIFLSREFDGVTQHLIQRRAKVPYKGYLAEPGGKVLFGEEVVAAAKRNMLAETGLECDMELRGLMHIKDEYQAEIVQDKYFFIVRATNPRGDLQPEGNTGQNLWMTLDQIKSNPKTHQGVVEMIAAAARPGFAFTERTHVTEEY